jgi:hypothetical protein
MVICIFNKGNKFVTYAFFNLFTSFLLCNYEKYLFHTKIVSIYICWGLHFFHLDFFFLSCLLLKIRKEGGAFWIHKSFSVESMSWVWDQTTNSTDFLFNLQQWCANAGKWNRFFVVIVCGTVIDLNFSIKINHRGCLKSIY